MAKWLERAEADIKRATERGKEYAKEIGEESACTAFSLGATQGAYESAAREMDRREIELLEKIALLGKELEEMQDA